MQVDVTFRQIEPNEALKKYAVQKLSKIKKYFDTPIEAHIVLKVEKIRHIIEVTLNVNGYKINGHEISGDMHSAIDMVMDKIEKQVKRYRKKLTGRSRKGEQLNRSEEMISDNITDEELEPQIIKTERIHVKPMDQDEAVMQLDLSGNNFLAFINSKNEQINVIYHRKDGNYGLIEPLK